MTIKKAIFNATQRLKNKKIDSATLDAEVLLAFILKKPREYLYTHPEKRLTKKELQKFSLFINRRRKHEPIAYITGHKEFFGLDFFINKHVLIPRPETELLVEEVLKIIHRSPITDYRLLDIGTGSGCIAISLAKHLPKIKITAIDSSKQALQVASQNAKKQKVFQKIKFLQGNLLEPLSKIYHLKFRSSSFELRASNYNLPFGSRGPSASEGQATSYKLITANLPYISTSEYKKLTPDIKNYEPKSALLAGPNGLKYYRQLFKQLRTTTWLRCCVAMWLLIEISPTQTSSIKKLIKKYFPTAKIQIKKDLANKNRVVIIKIN